MPCPDLSAILFRFNMHIFHIVSQISQYSHSVLCHFFALELCDEPSLGIEHWIARKPTENGEKPWSTPPNHERWILPVLVAPNIVSSGPLGIDGFC